MTKDLAEFLKTVSNNCGHNSEVSEYSGRGMFGQTTYGVTVQSMSVLVMDLLFYHKYNPTYIPPIHNDEFSLTSLRQDSLGYNVIIY